jgi:uncharacterized protein (TIGR03435 family)
MDQFENDLRDSLHEAGNQPSVAGKVMARVTASKKRTIISRYRFLIAAAAVVVAAVLVSASFFRSLISPDTVYAIVETGSLYRVDGRKTQVFGVGEKISSRTPVRTDDGAGAVLKLPDGASIEMHPQSELSLEPVTDGVTIRLKDGSLSVTPAKEPGANLYVQNQGVTTPVIGTVFQTTAPVVASTQDPVAQREGFEAVSIRPYVQTGNVGGAGARVPADGSFDNFNPCTTQLDPKRFAMLRAKVAALISMAYIHQEEPKMGCRDQSISGLPGWTTSEWFNVEAIAPDGAPLYTVGSFDRKTPTPRLEGMLRQMLADRFGLVVRREPKSTDVYVLSVAKSGSKLTPWKEGQPSSRTNIYGNYPDVLTSPSKHDYASRQIVGHISGRKVAMNGLVRQLGMFVNLPIVDRTGLTGDFDYEIVFAPTLPAERIEALRNQAGREPLPIMTNPTLFKALEEDLGLELKASKEKVEVLVVDRIERPSEN